jgi:hypothetical protein
MAHQPIAASVHVTSTATLAAKQATYGGWAVLEEKEVYPEGPNT